MADDLVTVGRIVKPHGIRGEVVVVPLTDHEEERFAPGTILRAGRRSLVVDAARPHQGRLLVTFEGVTDRTQAERLRGATLDAEPLDPDDRDVFLVSELEGMEVRDAGGRVLGVVTALVELPDAAGYDLLEVEREDGSSWLLPAVDEYVGVEEDDDGVRLVVSGAPDGLLEDG